MTKHSINIPNTHEVLLTTHHVDLICALQGGKWFSQVTTLIGVGVQVFRFSFLFWYYLFIYLFIIIIIINIISAKFVHVQYMIFKLFEGMAMRVVIQVLKPEINLTLNVRYLSCTPLSKVTSRVNPKILPGSGPQVCLLCILRASFLLLTYKMLLTIEGTLLPFTCKSFASQTKPLPHSSIVRQQSRFFFIFLLQSAEKLVFFSGFFFGHISKQHSKEKIKINCQFPCLVSIHSQKYRRMLNFLTYRNYSPIWLNLVMDDHFCQITKLRWTKKKNHTKMCKFFMDL